MRVVDLEIENIAFGGKGVGRENGKAVFVPYVIEGEMVSAEMVREKKQFAEAELVEIKQSSPHRVTPPCPYFAAAGRKIATLFAPPSGSVPRPPSPVLRVVTAGPKPPSFAV